MQSEMPFVSVIIPTHNRADLLKGTIDSLFKQTYPKYRYEIILIDNDSLDGTEDLIKSLQNDAPCALKYIRKEDEGPGVARNLGISMAKGEIIAFTEDDCMIDVHWIENGIAKMTDKIGLVQGKTLPNPHQMMKPFAHTANVEREKGFYETFNMFYRKSAVDLAGGFSKEFIGLDRFGKPIMGGEDVDLAWKVKKQGWESVFADNAIVYHHVFNDNLWKRALSHRVLQCFFYVLPNLVKKHPEIRQTILFRRFFWSKTTAYFDLFMLSIIFSLTLHLFFLIFTIPFLALLIKEVFIRKPLKTYPYGFVAATAIISVHFIMCTLLFFGSIRFRSIIL